MPLSMDVIEMADRIRAVVGNWPHITEKQMFGGIAFMLQGNMMVGPIKGGGMLVRVGKSSYEECLTLPGASPMMFTGREMPGYVEVSGDALEGEDALISWIERAKAFVLTLPAK